ncbi:MAG: putative holin-like toxin, partial [Clostridiales bacterium]|nr:putative holin-like toxin [Clostridiales bacterium]
MSTYEILSVLFQAGIFLLAL